MKNVFIFSADVKPNVSFIVGDKKLAIYGAVGHIFLKYFSKPEG